MSSLVLSGVGLSADHLPLRGSFLLPESPPPMLEEKEQPQPPVMAVAVRKRNLFCLQEERPAESSSETSSIGDADEDEDEEDDEVESKKREGCGGGGDGGGFDSFDSLEDSLPIKRGLSKFFSGKSKSFANIPDIAAATKVNVLAKPENPFNKRRRLAIRASFTYLPPPPPPPLCPNKDVEEEEEEEPEEEEVDSINGDRLVSLPYLLIQ